MFTTALLTYMSIYRTALHAAIYPVARLRTRPSDGQKEEKDRKSDTNPLSSAKFAFVNSVAWMTARLLRCKCTHSQRGIKRIGGIVRCDVHGDEGEERRVVVEGDL